MQAHCQCQYLHARSKMRHAPAPLAGSRKLPTVAASGPEPCVRRSVTLAPALSLPSGQVPDEADDAAMNARQAAMNARQADGTLAQAPEEMIVGRLGRMVACRTRVTSALPPNDQSRVEALTPSCPWPCPRLRLLHSSSSAAALGMQGRVGGRALPAAAGEPQARAKAGASPGSIASRPQTTLRGRRRRARCACAAH